MPPLNELVVFFGGMLCGVLLCGLIVLIVAQKGIKEMEDIK